MSEGQLVVKIMKQNLERERQRGVFKGASSWWIQTLRVRGRGRRHGAADSQTAGSGRAAPLTHNQAAAAWDCRQVGLERGREEAARRNLITLAGLF